MTTDVVRVAAIDCGTNSIRLLIADVPQGAEDARDLADVERDMIITRLGQGVDRTGMLDPAAIQRTLDAARLYQERIEDAGVADVIIAATSASRDASNRADFVEGIRAITGIEPRVITGAEEAALSFIGAISSLPSDLHAPYLVVDIGGGSTEFVLGHSAVEQAVSVNMGSVRVTERFGPEPWTPDKQAAARVWIDTQLDVAEGSVDFSAARTVVGVAGTVTSLAALIARVPEYSPDVTHGLIPTVEQWVSALDHMVNDSVEEKSRQPAMPPGRADVIAGGALIWERILVRLGVIPDPAGDDCASDCEAKVANSRQRAATAEGSASTAPTVVVSEHDILDGLALSIAAQQRD